MKTKGDKKMLRNLEKLEEKSINIAKKALFAEAANIIADSKENYVPVDTGNLRKSAHTDKPKFHNKTIFITFGYGGLAASYAADVHENPRAGKTGGYSPSGHKYKTWAKTGGWKYLEFPLKKALNGMAVRLAERIKRYVNR
jgi:hypothetical protein